MSTMCHEDQFCVTNNRKSPYQTLKGVLWFTSEASSSGITCGIARTIFTNTSQKHHGSQAKEHRDYHRLPQPPRPVASTPNR